MIHEVIVKTMSEETPDMGFPTTYTTASGEVRILVENDIFESFSPGYRGAYPDTKSITFKKTMPEMRFRYEGDAALQTDEDKKIRKLVEVYLKGHPCIVIDGNPHKGTKAPLFNLIDVSEVNNKKIRTWNKKLEVANIINGMTFTEKKDVCYYYGGNPDGKTENELVLQLGDFEDGDCMFENEPDKFISTWGGSESNPERNFIINANKAITMGIITNRPSAEDNRINYYLGDTFIGTDFNDVLGYCKREARVYSENILRVINQNEPKAEVKAAKVEPGDAKFILPDAELAELRQEAKILKANGYIDSIVMFHNMKGQNLVDVVNVGRAKKEEMDQAAIATAQESR